jgi:hypothetical protein
MSQPPNSMFSRSVSGRKFLMRGWRFSVRLPSRMWPICVVLPMGRRRPFRMAMTPAMKVEDTAPMPGVRMPSFPVAGWICRCSGIL